MYWAALLIAGLLEVIWAIGLKYTHGFTKLSPTIITLSALAISFSLLAFAMRAIPLSIAYIIWVGIGILGTSIFGIMVLNESISPLKIVSLSLIIIGIVGLKISH
ncbi:quaternary ammonium compound efflux SMR transporter SugE [Shewanella intestini]|uniref:Guanidinium exporter n=1 Tax=Shewanella intestini TaxID=2017544 RepID=A0ABS5I1B5_9GAMM|nr:MULTISPECIES: quaternary ammonium compound efflux SMR transporter SugE [Shewanella]MBR9727807.1 quaternary ammonium compound efflux SMR transporter SugE [Shewanella intestini]MRG36200.1 quaternary ammonium compound efflux SMR transporter SugE [Shewanella sp. XMDDZSB0408]